MNGSASTNCFLELAVGLIRSLHRTLTTQQRRHADLFRTKLRREFPPACPRSGSPTSVAERTEALTTVRREMEQSPAQARRQALASPDTIHEAVRRPPSDFGYQPVHAFWSEVSKHRPLPRRRADLHDWRTARCCRDRRTARRRSRFGQTANSWYDTNMIEVKITDVSNINFTSTVFPQRRR